MNAHNPVPSQQWHALFAPLPPDALPRRQPVAPPEVLAKPEGAAIAGWEQLTVELSAREAGMRIAMVVLDANGTPISASDWVMYRSELLVDGEILIEYIHENVGGRLEADGTFRGTRWHTVTVETADGTEVQNVPVSSPPSADDERSLKALVAEIVRRAPR